MNVMIAVIGLRWRTNRSLLDTLLTPVGDQLPPPSDSRMQGLIRPSVSWRRAAVLTTAISTAEPAAHILEWHRRAWRTTHERGPHHKRETGRNTVSIGASHLFFFLF